MGWLFKRLRTNSGDRLLVLNFLRAVQRACARQQLAMEEWNDALAAQSLVPIGGDESSNPPVATIADADAALLLPVAERRFASALLVRDEFAKLPALEMPDILESAVYAWARAFEVHLRRCEQTVINVQALPNGTRLMDRTEELQLQSDDVQAMIEAGAAQSQVMKKWRISPVEHWNMMLEACNNVRLEIGKPKFTMADYRLLCVGGMEGEPSRFYA